MLQTTGGTVIPDMMPDPLGVVTADGQWSRLTGYITYHPSLRLWYSNVKWSLLNMKFCNGNKFFLLLQWVVTNNLVNLRKTNGKYYFRQFFLFVFVFKKACKNLKVCIYFFLSLMCQEKHFVIPVVLDSNVQKVPAPFVLKKIPA